MNTQTARKLLTIMAALACMLTANTAHSSIDGARLIGLAMHQEVGRNIYIGAIHYNSQIPVPVDIVGAAGPKTMEYRVVARRTSIRSLIGSILLQGELATGKPPNANAIEFAGDLMSAVQGSLYAGDSLTISLDSSNTLVASLNGQQLARSTNRDVADYLLMGWVSERGPSQAFRHSILAPSIDSSLMTSYDQHAASAERVAAIQAWGETEETTDTAAETATESLDTAVENTIIASSTEQGIVLDPGSLNSSYIAQEAAELITLATNDSDSSSDTPVSPAALTTDTSYLPESAGEEQTPAEPIQLASLTLTREMINTESDAIETWDAIDAIEYTQRLATFNNHVMRSVYAKIRYPKAAVRRNIEGKLELDLTVAKDGSLLNVEVALTSGNQWLDKSAVKAAESAFSSAAVEGIDAVSVAEYGDAAGDTLLIPVPISFVLTE